MELNVVEKMIPKKFIVTEFGEIPLYDMMEIIEGLEDSSWASRIVIYDSNITKWLISLGIINDTSKGSVYKSDNNEKFNELKKAVYDLTN